MLIYYNSQNQPVKLLKELGRGGEGVVYNCEGELLVGKIYHQPISDEKAGKLLWMAEHKTEQLLKTTAWVAEILKDKPEGKVVGFMMPKIKAKEIHELYAPKSRRVYFPDATWHFLVHTATNLARAFHNLHKDGHVMGDVNQGNCVVTADGTVKLIDCDSYGIKTDNKTYPCEVGVITHIPPELQGKNLRNIKRTENHDNFGLAIVIFQLLFLGRHPFSGNYLGNEDKSLEDAIREHLFVYGKDAKLKNVVQPPGTPPLSAASLEVAELFERAFSAENNRPQPYEWISGLEFLADNLQQCLLNPGHVFYSKLTLCPWCEIEEDTGLILFPFTISNNALTKKYERTFDIATIEKLVDSFDLSNAYTNIFSEDMLPVKPASYIMQVCSWQIFTTLVICISYLFVFVYIYYLLPYCILPLSIIGGVAAWAALKNIELSNYENVKIEEEVKLESLLYEKTKIETAFSKHLEETKLPLNLALIQSKLKTYEEINNFITSEIENNESRLQLQNEISSLLAKLRLSSVQNRQKFRELTAKSQHIIQSLPSVQANVKGLKLHLPFTLSFAFTNVILFGLFFSGVLPTEDSKRKYTSSTYSSGYNYNDSRSTTVSAKAPIETNIPPDSITDEEIKVLSDNERNQIVKQLINKSSLAIDTKNNQKAQKYLNFALRFDKNNGEILNLLGRALYNSGKYNEALKQFDEVKKIDPEKIDNFYLGMTYQSLKRYNEARDIFHKITSQNASSAGLYNLGQAYIGLKDYKSAAHSFGMAIKISPGDTDSLYQLGICFSKLKDNQGVRDTYASLKAMNSPNAEEFRKVVGKSFNLEDSTKTQKPRPTGVFKIATSGEDEPPPLVIKK